MVGSEIEEERLRADTGFARPRRKPTVAAGRKQLPRGKRIGEISVENLVTDPMSQRPVLQRNDDLDTAIEIPRHQVRASDEGVFDPAVSEVPDPTVFQEAADDAANANPVA